MLPLNALSPDSPLGRMAKVALAAHDSLPPPIFLLINSPGKNKKTEAQWLRSGFPYIPAQLSSAHLVSSTLILISALGLILLY
ncbi:hypothetical protein HMPREF9374_0469 [Desmospora sp. 8437]|nr:hypothetical protein HMPREF9374_0469 [Desmospora sp. 8437]